VAFRNHLSHSLFGISDGCVDPDARCIVKQMISMRDSAQRQGNNLEFCGLESWEYLVEIRPMASEFLFVSEDDDEASCLVYLIKKVWLFDQAPHIFLLYTSRISELASTMNENKK